MTGSEVRAFRAEYIENAIENVPRFEKGKKLSAVVATVFLAIRMINTVLNIIFNVQFFSSSSGILTIVAFVVIVLFVFAIIGGIRIEVLPLIGGLYSIFLLAKLGWFGVLFGNYYTPENASSLIVEWSSLVTSVVQTGLMILLLVSKSRAAYVKEITKINMLVNAKFTQKSAPEAAVANPETIQQTESEEKQDGSTDIQK